MVASKERPINVAFPQGSIFGAAFFLLFAMNFMMLSVILLATLILLFTLNMIRLVIWSMGDWLKLDSKKIF